MDMIIEEQEDGAVRGLLGTAFGVAEPPLRDFASGSIARGDAARSRNRRLLAAGGAGHLREVQRQDRVVGAQWLAPQHLGTPCGFVTSLFDERDSAHFVAGLYHAQTQIEFG